MNLSQSPIVFAALEVRNATFNDSDGTPVLRNVWLEARPDTTTCIVGSTGQDQATLLAMMAGLIAPTSGSVCLDGVGLDQLTVQEVRADVALVLTDPWITPGSVGENIRFGNRNASRASVASAAETAGFDPSMAALDAPLKTAGGPVPLETRRRLALARALVRSPRVLIIEEPTANLAPDDERRFLSLLTKIGIGRALVVATHRLSVARRANQVLVIDAGKLVPYSGTSPARGTSDHSRLWDVRAPDRTGPRHPARPVTNPWGIAPGATIKSGSKAVSDYVVSGLLGRGQHCDTWAAWSERRQRPVRIKLPSSVPVDYACYEAMLREFKSVSQLRHPGLGVTYEADLESEMPFVAYEYLDSPSLALVAAEGLDPLDVLAIGFELAGAINYMHQRGFAHLDISARDVRTRSGTVVLTDFAAIHPIGQALAQPPTRPFSWVPPEQLDGRPADPRMDIFALGALLHRATSGISPEPTSGAPGLVAGELHIGPVAPYASLAPKTPTGMGELIDRMLAPDAADRPDAIEVLRRFRRMLPSTLFRPRAAEREPNARHLHAVGALN